MSHCGFYVFHFRLKQETAELVFSENTFRWQRQSQLPSYGGGTRVVVIGCSPHVPDGCMPRACRCAVVSSLVKQALVLSLMCMPASSSISQRGLCASCSGTFFFLKRKHKMNILSFSESEHGWDECTPVCSYSLAPLSYPKYSYINWECSSVVRELT